MKKIWTPEELNKLQEFCKASHAFSELKEKIKDVFNGERSWLAIRAKIYQHKDWFSHFANEEKFLVFLRRENQRPKSFDEVSALLDIPKEEILLAFKKLDIPERARAENLSLEQWVSLSIFLRPIFQKK